MKYDIWIRTCNVLRWHFMVVHLRMLYALGKILRSTLIFFGFFEIGLGTSMTWVRVAGDASRKDTMEEATILHYPYTKLSDLTSLGEHCGCHYAPIHASECFMNLFDRYVCPFL